MLLVFYIILMSASFWCMLYPIVWSGPWFSSKGFGKTWKYSCWIKFMLQMFLVSIYWQFRCGWIYFLSYSIIVCYLLAHQACDSWHHFLLFVVYVIIWFWWAFYSSCYIKHKFGTFGNFMTIWASFFIIFLKISCACFCFPIDNPCVKRVEYEELLVDYFQAIYICHQFWKWPKAFWRSKHDAISWKENNHAYWRSLKVF